MLSPKYRQPIRKFVCLGQILKRIFQDINNALAIQQANRPVWNQEHIVYFTGDDIDRRCHFRAHIFIGIQKHHCNLKAGHALCFGSYSSHFKDGPVILLSQNAIKGYHHILPRLNQVNINLRYVDIHQ